MVNPSNLYAEKIFSEHPLALWALDDQSDFVSLINSLDKRLASTNWSISGGTKNNIIPSSLILPIPEAPTAKITSNTNSSTIRLESRNILNFKDLDSSKNTFNFALYFNAGNPDMQNVKLGYKYGSVEVLETFSIPIDNAWVFLNKAFEVPNIDSEFKLIIEINHNQTTPTGSAFDFYINGMSLGQWSEEFHIKSTGVDAINLPTNIALPPLKAVATEAYGLRISNGYYIINNNSLKAINSGIPMVYGASNLTKLIPNNDLPSLIVPGFGFMNEVGQYKDFTAEMWLRINSKTTQARRIFGPIGKVYEDAFDNIGEDSSDGLYVDGPFLTLKIGDNIGSHFVGEWGRPMLVQIRLINNGASLLVNGEEVLSLSTRTSELKFAASKGRGLLFDKDQDWLGFYAYEDVPLIEVDCVAIYSYQVPEVVAKRRFVYGQGVDFPENLNTSYNGTSAFIDYKVANYANNYLYPDIGRWQQGILENVSTANNQLSSPEYTLPTITTPGSITEKQWLDFCLNQYNNSDEIAPFLNFEAASGGYMLFENIGLFDQDLKGFYGIFKTNSDGEQLLFKIEDSSTKNYFEISAVEDKIKYVLKYGASSPQTIYEVNEHIVGMPFAVGLDIAKFSRRYGKNIATFFGNKNRLKIYAAGQPGFENSAISRVYKIGFCTQRNLNKISYLFKDNGTMRNPENVFNLYFDEDGQIDITLDGGYFDIDPLTPEAGWVLGSAVRDGNISSTFTTIDGILNHTASYTLIPKLYLGSLQIDIATDSYWQDYIPLKYFGKFVKDFESKSRYDLDFIQLNVGYPALSNIINDKYNTSNSLVKTYLTFQYLSENANRSDELFTNTEMAPANDVIIPGLNWKNTRYEFVNDTIVYLPPNVNFAQLAIVVHIQILSNGIQTAPVKIKTLQLAGEAFDSLSPTVINTKFGVPLFPYRKRGIYLDYKGENPLAIYKNSTPYLYLTENSGIRLKGEFDSLQERGISLRINEAFSPSYKVGALQVAMKYPEELFPTNPIEIFNIDSIDQNRNNVLIRFFVVADNPERTRGKVYAINNLSGLPYPGLVMYLNGSAVQTPYINIKEWNMLGVQFVRSLDFASYRGALNITGPMLMNNISTYQLSATQEATTFIYRTWGQVPNMLDKNDDPETELDESVTFFEDFLPENFNIEWENILFIPVTKSYSLDPSAIYRTYLGTNKTIIQDSNVLMFKDYSYRLYKNVRWQSNILSAV
jgi:hypothetical protein